MARFQAIAVPVFRAVPGYEIPEQGWAEVDVGALSKSERAMLDLHLERRTIRIHPHDRAALGPNTAAPPSANMAAPPAVTAAPAPAPAKPKAPTTGKVG